VPETKGQAPTALPTAGGFFVAGGFPNDTIPQTSLLISLLLLNIVL